MGLLRITNLEYKASSNVLENTYLDTKTCFWIGKNNNEIDGNVTNTLAFTISKQYLDYLESKFAKVTDAKLYLKILRNTLNNNIDDISLTYKNTITKKICKYQRDFLVIDLLAIFKKNIEITEIAKIFYLAIDNNNLNYIIFDKDQSYMDIDYKPIGNTNNNRPIINHQFGRVDLVEGINQIDIFDIGCKNINIKHLYNSRRSIDENYYCGKKWSLNINQKLLKNENTLSENKSDLYLYQDGTGMVEELLERFYIDVDDKRIYIKKEDVKLLDGALEYIYRGIPYIVNVEHLSKHGFKLQTNIEEYKKDISLEIRDEEVASLEEQIKALGNQKKEIESSLEMLNKNNELEKISKEIRILENLLENQTLEEDMSQNSIYNQYKGIKDKIFDIEKRYNTYLNDFNGSYYKIDKKNIYVNNQLDNYLENDLIIHNTELEKYKKDPNNDNVYTEKVVNEINVNNYLSALQKKLKDLMNNISKEYYDKNDELSKTNYQTQKKNYEDSIKEIEENLKIYEERLEKVQRKNPINYLINEQKEIYCFNKYGDLVNIIDSFGNKLSIEYLHDKVYRVLNDEEECLKFKYKNDLLVELKNNLGDKTIFKYDNEKNLTSIKRNNETINFYYNDKHLLTEILDDKDTGYQFIYNTDSRISKLLEITYASKITDETFSVTDTYITKNTNSIIYDSLNKVTVYNGIDDKNLSTTYVYDDDNNIKYIEYEYFDYEINKKTKERTLYDYVKNDYRIEARVKKNKSNLLENKDLLHLNKNGQYYMIIGNNKHNSIASIRIPKERLENYSYLILSVDAVANSFYVKKENQHYMTNNNSDLESNDPRFEIKFKTIYTNGKIDVQSQSFDWNISEEQNLFFPVLVNQKYKKEYKNLPTEFPILLDSEYEIQEYVISIDYSNNNEELLFRNLYLQEGQFKYQRLNEDDLVIFECDETNLYEKYNEYDEKQLQKEIILRNDKQFETIYHYDKDGNLLDTINHLGIITEHTYNDQKIETITSTYHKDEPVFKFYQERTIDEEGNLVEEKDETGLYTTQYKYDDKKVNVSKIINPNNSIMYYHQTPDHKVASQSMVIDSQPNTNTKFYNKGLLTKLVNSKLKYQFEYDGFGRKTKIIINDNPYCTIHYDDKNKKQTIKYASKTGFVYTNNLNNELAEVDYIDENGQKHPYLTKEYNGNGKIIKKNEYDNHLCYNETTYNYDELENLTCIICDNYQIDNEYDNLNRIKKETISMEEEIESYQYIYDDEDEIKEVILPNTKKQTKTKDVYGRTKTITYDNIKTDYKYKQVEDHLTNLVEDYNIITPDQTINYIYTYDEMGNIILIKENQEEVITYEYDKASRLVKENNKKLNSTKEYIYDEIGNIISIKEYNYLEQEQQIKTTKNEYDDLGRLIKHNNDEIEYDIEGNPTRYQDKEIIFDKGNLVQYGRTTYKYDTNKIRKEKTTNNLTTTYITIENRIIEEKNSKYKIKYYYGINGIISFKYNEKEYKYIKDITNNIVGIIDDKGIIVARYIYDGWGKHIVIDKEGKENQEETFIGNINPIRYKGYYYDKETKLFYCNSRYYSPELCRFISPDSIEYLDPESVNGLNLYCYCLNNPIYYCDPSGHFVLSSFLIAVGIGAAAGFLSQYIPDVIANIKDGGFQFSDLLTINGDNWRDYAGAIIAGAIGGAAGGLGLNLFGTMLFAGTGQVIGDLFAGEIDSFGDAANTFLKAAFTAGLSYGITSAVSAGFGKLQMNSKILNGSSKNIKINARIKNLTGSYGKALNGMKIGRNTTSQFLKQLAFTNSNMALTESTGGVISILLALGGF